MENELSISAKLICVLSALVALSITIGVLTMLDLYIPALLGIVIWFVLFGWMLLNK